MSINEKFLLQAQKEIIINTSVEVVWGVLTDIAAWPKWQMNVKYARLEGKLVVGSRFLWKAGGVKIVSEIIEIEENKLISWRGKALGMIAVHDWRFYKNDNKTKVITKESLSGWVPAIIKLFKPKFLEESLEKSLEVLKNYSEKNAKE